MPIANDLADYVSRWDLTGDFQTYARGIGQMFVEVEGYAEDTDTVVGWQPLWDYTIASHNALVWLAMVYGEVAPQGATDDQLRALIQAAPNAKRGTPNAVAGAIKQTLTGGQLVAIRERHTDAGTADDDAIAIITLSSQTPNQNAVQAAIRRTLPADIEPYYQCLSGATWASLEGGLSWATIESTTGPTWHDVEASVLFPGYDLY